MVKPRRRGSLRTRAKPEPDEEANATVYEVVRKRKQPHQGFKTLRPRKTTRRLDEEIDDDDHTIDKEAEADKEARVKVGKLRSSGQSKSQRDDAGQKEIRSKSSQQRRSLGVPAADDTDDLDDESDAKSVESSLSFPRDEGKESRRQREKNIAPAKRRSSRRGSGVSISKKGPSDSEEPPSESDHEDKCPNDDPKYKYKKGGGPSPPLDQKNNKQQHVKEKKRPLQQPMAQNDEDGDAPEEKDGDEPEEKQGGEPEETQGDGPEEKQGDETEETQGGVLGEEEEDADAPEEKQGGAPGEKDVEASVDKEGDTPGEKDGDAPEEKQGGAPREKDVEASEDKEGDTPGEKDGDTPEEKQGDASEEKQGDEPDEKEGGDAPEEKQGDETEGKEGGDAPEENDGDAPEGIDGDAPGEKDGDAPEEKQGVDPEEKQGVEPEENQGGASGEKVGGAPPEEKDGDTPGETPEEKGGDAPEEKFYDAIEDEESLGDASNCVTLPSVARKGDDQSNFQEQRKLTGTRTPTAGPEPISPTNDVKEQGGSKDGQDVISEAKDSALEGNRAPTDQTSLVPPLTKSPAADEQAEVLKKKHGVESEPLVEKGASEDQNGAPDAREENDDDLLVDIGAPKNQEEATPENDDECEPPVGNAALLDHEEATPENEVRKEDDGVRESLVDDVALRDQEEATPENKGRVENEVLDAGRQEEVSCEDGEKISPAVDIAPVNEAKKKNDLTVQHNKAERPSKIAAVAPTETPKRKSSDEAVEVSEDKTVEVDVLETTADKELDKTESETIDRSCVQDAASNHVAKKSLDIPVEVSAEVDSSKRESVHRVDGEVVGQVPALAGSPVQAEAVSKQVEICGDETIGDKGEANRGADVKRTKLDAPPENAITLSDVQTRRGNISNINRDDGESQTFEKSPDDDKAVSTDIKEETRNLKPQEVEDKSLAHAEDPKEIVNDESDGSEAVVDTRITVGQGSIGEDDTALEIAESLPTLIKQRDKPVAVGMPISQTSTVGQNASNDFMKGLPNQMSSNSDPTHQQTISDVKALDPSDMESSRDIQQPPKTPSPSGFVDSSQKVQVVDNIDSSQKVQAIDHIKASTPGEYADNCEDGERRDGDESQQDTKQGGLEFSSSVLHDRKQHTSESCHRDTSSLDAARPNNAEPQLAQSNCSLISVERIARDQTQDPPLKADATFHQKRRGDSEPQKELRTTTELKFNETPAVKSKISLDGVNITYHHASSIEKATDVNAQRVNSSIKTSDQTLLLGRPLPNYNANESEQHVNDSVETNLLSVEIVSTHPDTDDVSRKNESGANFTVNSESSEPDVSATKEVDGQEKKCQPRTRDNSGRIVNSEDCSDYLDNAAMSGKKSPTRQTSDERSMKRPRDEISSETVDAKRVCKSTSVANQNLEPNSISAERTSVVMTKSQRQPKNKILDTTSRRLDLERVKLALYERGKRAHKEKHYDFLFAQYWQALSLKLSGSAPMKEVVRNQLIIKKFLKNKKLRVLHNKLILGLLERCAKREFTETDIPSNTLAHISCLIKFKPQVRVSEKNPFPVPKASCTIPSVPATTRSITKEELEETPILETFSSSRIPGALLVDPYVRIMAQSQGMRINESAVWLVVVAMKDYAKMLLSDCIEAAKSIDLKKEPTRVTEIPMNLSQAHWKDEEVGEVCGSETSNPTAKVLPTKEISSLDVHAVLSRMPVSARSLSGCVSRVNYERSLRACHFGNKYGAGLEDTAFENVRAYSFSKIAPPPQPPKTIVQSNRSSEAAATIDKDVTSIGGKPTSSADALKSTSIVPDDDTTTAALGKGSKDLSALVARSASTAPLAPRTGDAPAEISSPKYAAGAKDSPAAEPAVTSARGTGAGTKNLAAILARSTYVDPTVEPASAKEPDAGFEPKVNTTTHEKEQSRGPEGNNIATADSTHPHQDDAVVQSTAGSLDSIVANKE